MLPAWGKLQKVATVGCASCIECGDIFSTPGYVLALSVLCYFLSLFALQRKGTSVTATRLQSVGSSLGPRHLFTRRTKGTGFNPAWTYHPLP